MAITGRSQRRLTAVKLPWERHSGHSFGLSKSGRRKRLRSVSKKFARSIFCLPTRRRQVSSSGGTAVRKLTLRRAVLTSTPRARISYSKGAALPELWRFNHPYHQLVSHHGLPTGSLYCTPQPAAMRSLTRFFASALVERNIRVNAVSPRPNRNADFRANWAFPGIDGRMWPPMF